MKTFHAMLILTSLISQVCLAQAKVYLRPAGVPFSARGPEQCRALTGVDVSKFGATRNQGQMGICASYATSDILSYCVQTKNPNVSKGTQISALDLAAQYTSTVWDGVSIDDFKTAMNAGSNPALIMNALTSGRNYACRETSMTSDPESFDQLTGTTDPLKIFNGTIFVDTNGYLIDHPGLKIADVQTAVEHQLQGSLYLLNKIERLQNEYDSSGKLSCMDFKNDNGCFHKLSKYHPELFGDQAFIQLLQSQRANPAQLLLKIDSKLCTPAKALSIDACILHTDVAVNANQTAADTMAGQTLFPDLDSQLSSGNPVAISVTSDFLQTPAKSGGGGHEMVVVARDFKEGECSYQIRNSWGSDCQAYKNSTTVKDCDSSTGYFWVGEKVLADNLGAIDFFPLKHQVILAMGNDHQQHCYPADAKPGAKPVDDRFCQNEY